MSLKDILLGRRLANKEYDRRKIGAFEGVPAMGLDGLGSSAYGTAGLPAPRLVVVPAAYRAIHEPILRLVDEVETQFPHQTVSVLIPEIVKTRWYQHILHPSHAAYLRRQLLRHGGARITVMSVPWNLDELSETRGKQPRGPMTGRRATAATRSRQPATRSGSEP